MKLTRPIQRLIETAVSAQKNAYCPYSRYAVGAAVLTEGGRIFAGCMIFLPCRAGIGPSFMSARDPVMRPRAADRMR